ncbi:Cro/Cl family transcriptional regulator, partial [Dysosmobacter welbionis]
APTSYSPSSSWPGSARPRHPERLPDRSSLPWPCEFSAGPDIPAPPAPPAVGASDSRTGPRPGSGPADAG